MDAQTTTETGAVVVAKAAPPVTVSIATLAGYSVSELLVLATLIYTVIMITHKLYTIAVEIRDRHWSGPDRRNGEPDTRDTPVERRK